MLTRAVRVKLLVFVLIAVLGVGYTGIRYAGLGRVLGLRGYTVHLELADSGGLFPNAEVTYRGVTVGRVGAMRLTDTGLVADLDMSRNGPRIPANLTAAVADRSAVGEQYVDLRPNTDAGPYLGDGSDISQSRTSTPLPVDTLLGNIDDLATSVPTDSLRTVVDELGTAFNGTGPALQRLLDDVSAFTSTATQHVPQTTGLIAEATTVLRTQNNDADLITSFSQSLNQLTAQLRDSDPVLRQLIAITPEVAAQLRQVLAEDGPNLGVLLANLLTTANLVATRTNGIEQLLVAYPMISALGYTVAPGDGTLHMSLNLSEFNPPPCTNGYQGTDRRTASDLSNIPPNQNAYCAEPPTSPTDVRGAQNAPFGGVPTSPTAAASDAQPVTAQPAGEVFGSGDGPTTLADLLGVGPEN